MNLQNLESQLSQLANVDFCNYNGENTNQLIIVLTGFDPEVNKQNLDSILQSITEFPKITEYSINFGVVKIQLDS